MIVPVALGVAALYGLYSWDKKRKSTVAQAGATSTAPGATDGGTNIPATTVAANNPTGAIAYTPKQNIPGFGTQAQHVVVPPASVDTVYPPASTRVDPNAPQMKPIIAAFQAARPQPSNQFYYPAKGDYWTGGVQARLGGTPKARIEDGSHNKDIPLSLVSAADVGKLNGLVTASDLNDAVKAGKALRLPVGGWSDVSGPTIGAMGSIR